MDRRSVLSGGGMLLAARMLTGEAHARARSSRVTEEDAKFMRIAIEQAKGGDAPFGAVIVRGGRVQALGANRTSRDADPTAHAEMVAIRSFLAGHDAESFHDATLYASGEPCAMCMGAIIWCGIKRLVFAASVDQLTARIEQIDISARHVADRSPFANIEIAGGLMSREAMALFPKDEK